MVRTGILVVGALFLLAHVGLGSPEKGARSSFQEIPAQGAYEQTLKFHGGDRACVIAKGEMLEGGGNDAAGVIRIEVHDAAGKQVVAEQDAGGYAVGFWYPPRDAVYKVQVRNAAAAKKTIYVTIK